MRIAEREAVRAMTGPMGRQTDDQRSAQKIIEQSAVLRDYLGGDDHWQLDVDLKRDVGDWTENNPAPDSRANAAYNLDKVLRLIDNLDEDTLIGSEERNGKIDGFSERGVAIQKDSEADRLDKFARNGYEALRSF